MTIRHVNQHVQLCDFYDKYLGIPNTKNYTCDNFFRVDSAEYIIGKRSCVLFLI